KNEKVSRVCSCPRRRGSTATHENGRPGRRHAAALLCRPTPTPASPPHRIAGGSRRWRPYLHDGWHLSKLAGLRDKAEALGKMGDAISAEVSRGRALGYYIERRESGAAGAFQAKTREEADKILEETIAKIEAKQAIERAKQTP